MERVRGGVTAGDRPSPCPACDDALRGSADAVVAQAMGALLWLRLDTPQRPREGVGTQALASSFELSKLVGLFLKIREPDRRRRCLAMLRDFAEAADRA